MPDWWWPWDQRPPSRDDGAGRIGAAFLAVMLKAAPLNRVRTIVPSQGMNEMTIAALARAGAVGVETVRYYQRRGLLERPERHGSSAHGSRSLRLSTRLSGRAKSIRSSSMSRCSGFFEVAPKDRDRVLGSQRHAPGRAVKL
jgi:hypothetical protein